MSTGIRILFFAGLILAVMIAHRAVKMRLGKEAAASLVLGAVLAVGIICYFKYFR